MRIIQTRTTWWIFSWLVSVSPNIGGGSNLSKLSPKTTRTLALSELSSITSSPPHLLTPVASVSSEAFLAPRPSMFSSISWWRGCPHTPFKAAFCSYLHLLQEKKQIQDGKTWKNWVPLVWKYHNLGAFGFLFGRSKSLSFPLAYGGGISLKKQKCKHAGAN